MIIGESPGKTELNEERVFCGPGGKRLLEWLSETGLGADRDQLLQEFYMTSICKCYLCDHSDWPQASANCIGFLEEQIDNVDPQVVLLLGMRVSRRLFHLKGRLQEYFGRSWNEADFHAPLVRILPEQAEIYVLPHPSPQTTPWLSTGNRRGQLTKIMKEIGSMKVSNCL